MPAGTGMRTAPAGWHPDQPKGQGIDATAGSQPAIARTKPGATARRHEDTDAPGEREERQTHHKWLAHLKYPHHRRRTQQ